MQTLTKNGKQVKTIKIETNYNNKLSCQRMLHISLAPGDRLRESELENTVVQIGTTDGSAPVSDWKLVDLIRLPLHQVTDLMTWQSHGMDSFSFAKLILNKFSSSDTYLPVAIYFYQRVSFEG